MTYRILSLDGGNGGKAGVFLSTLERRADVLGFSVLGQIDLFAGTSNGAVNALLMAWFDDPVLAFEAVLRFDDEVRESQTPWSIAGTVMGNNAAMTTGRIKAFCDDVFGPGAILADVKRPVMVSTVQLDNALVDAQRSWSPRTFTNFAGDIGRVELIVDVVLRTMAMPLQYPIYQGGTESGPAYVDGAVASNNPAMTALAAALGQGRKLEDIALLSIGTPRNLAGQSRYLAPRLSEGSADWGYRQWLLDPFNPLVLVDLFLQSGATATSAQCAQLLGARFQRVDPPVFTGPAWDAPESNVVLDATVDWLKAQGWEHPAPAKAPAAPAE
ncbi:patatin-like phospholipase family protein [Xanthobacter autotrophicus]|uniref:patatin-like phospholipase family protein n=1 Tax=Xanthobacter TaxID=279 RepID=UPI0024AA421B|nr:patatin-like phospholipase family protein [Xanthobacter autotrophicus]MDI4663601.1 patatin-like phospholipase family protein [Xanthobacter autotrophicus]